MHIHKDTPVAAILEATDYNAEVLAVFGIKEFSQRSRQKLLDGVTVELAARAHHVPVEELIYQVKQVMDEQLLRTG